MSWQLQCHKVSQYNTSIRLYIFAYIYEYLYICSDTFSKKKYINRYMKKTFNVKLDIIIRLKPVACGMEDGEFSQ